MRQLVHRHVFVQRLELELLRSSWRIAVGLLDRRPILNWDLATRQPAVTDPLGVGSCQEARWGGVGWGRAKGYSKYSQCGVQSAETSVKSSLGRPSELSRAHARSPCSAPLSLRYGKSWCSIT